MSDSAEALEEIVKSKKARGKDRTKAMDKLAKRAKKGDEDAIEACKNIVKSKKARGKDRTKASDAL